LRRREFERERNAGVVVEKGKRIGGNRIILINKDGEFGWMGQMRVKADAK
jgi:hypothetical protein